METTVRTIKDCGTRFSRSLLTPLKHGQKEKSEF